MANKKLNRTQVLEKVDELSKKLRDRYVELRRTKNILDAFEELEKEMKSKIAKIVNSLYYYDKPNVYRPNFSELDSKMFKCPRCKSHLSIPRNTASCPFYKCPNCGFKIPFESVLHTRERVEEYMAEQKQKQVDEVVKESIFIKESDPPKKAGLNDKYRYTFHREEKDLINRLKREEFVKVKEVDHNISAPLLNSRIIEKTDVIGKRDEYFTLTDIGKKQKI
jgi:DNA-directed RNA polymerase subunit RPC12/RpoP